MSDQEKFSKMLAGAAAGKNGRGTLCGKLVQFRSRINHGTSGKGTTTYWYVDGRRTALSKIRSMVEEG